MDQRKLVEFWGNWVILTIVLLILSSILGANVHLGNAKVSMPVAGVISGLILSIANVLVPVGINKLGFKIKDEKALIGANFVVFVVVIWIIKTLADITGLGVANIFYVLILAAVLSVLNWATPKGFQLFFKK